MGEQEAGNGFRNLTGTGAGSGAGDGIRSGAGSTGKGSIRRRCEGELRLMKEKNRKLYAVEIWALNGKVNRNGWQYTRLEEHLEEFREIPILTAYLNDGEVIGDGHNFRIREGPKGEYASFTDPEAERIVGLVDRNARIEIRQRDGESWIVCTGYIWKWYARELVDKLREDGSIGVSIETIIQKEHRVGEVKVEDEYVVLGITILGNGVTPAVEGARIRSLAALREAIEEDSMVPQGDRLKSNQIFEKRERKRKMITPRRLKELAAGFPGYCCISATEDERVVTMLSANGTAYSYTFGEEETEPNPERVKRAGADVVFHVDGLDVEANFDSVTDFVSAAMDRLESENRNLSTQNAKLVAQVADMLAKEKARRLKAARECMTDELASRNRNREEDRKFRKEICAALESRIDAGEFTEMENGEGIWIGDAAIRSAVSALCMDEQSRMDAETAGRAKSLIDWGTLVRNSEEAMTVGEKLARG